MSLLNPTDEEAEIILKIAEEKNAPWFSEILCPLEDLAENDSAFKIGWAPWFLWFSDDQKQDIQKVGAEPVRHGRWNEANVKAPKYACSCCQHIFSNRSYKYCPNCGAKMDLEDGKN